MSGVNRPKALMRKVLRDREREFRKGCGEVLGLAAWPKVWQERFTQKVTFKRVNKTTTDSTEDNDDNQNNLDNNGRYSEM